MGEKAVKFGFNIVKLSEDQYSFGACISSGDWNGERECYLYLNLVKWTVSIGWFA